MGRKIVRRRVIRATREGGWRPREEKLAGEEPLEIRFGHTSYTTSMRTPGDDFDMVAGFLVGEGVIRASEQLLSLRYCAGTDEEGNQTFNVIEVQLGPGATPPDVAKARNVVTSSACGICGTNWRPCWICPTPCASRRSCSLPPGECTRRGCFPPPANC